MLFELIKRIFRGGSGGQPPPQLAAVQSLLEAGALERANALLADLLKQAPGCPEVHLWQGRLAARCGRYGDATAAFDRALTLRPGWTDALLEQALAFKELGRFEAAIAALDRVIALDPGDHVAYTNRGLALRELGRYAEAEASLRRAVELSPLSASGWGHLGLFLIEQGRIDEAIHLLQGILAQTPEDPDAHLYLATAYLRRGEFALGWPHFEYRLRRATAQPRRHEFPEWQGGSIGNGALLIVPEMGPGDEIMFASCFPDVLARVAPVVIECEPRLVALFSRSFPGAVVRPALPDRAGSNIAPDFPIAAQISAGSLPGLFRGGWEAFPQRSGYLVPDPAKVDRWRSRLAGMGPGRRIGLSWQGGTVRTRRLLRSMALATLLPVLRVPGTQFVSLQYTPSEEEIAALRDSHGVVVHSFPEANADFDELAALVSCLDLVVSVQTAVVHLCGALGRPCWVLVPAVAEWRYLSEGERMPWYPSVRLFRQTQLGDWGPVITRVAAELEGFRS